MIDPSRSHRAIHVAARHAAWARMHRDGASIATIARRNDVDPSTVWAALNKPAGWTRKNASRTTRQEGGRHAE